MAQIHLAAPVSGSWFCVCWFTVTLSESRYTGAAAVWIILHRHRNTKQRDVERVDQIHRLNLLLNCLRCGQMHSFAPHAVVFRLNCGDLSGRCIFDLGSDPTCLIAQLCWTTSRSNLAVCRKTLGWYRSSQETQNKRKSIWRFPLDTRTNPCPGCTVVQLAQVSSFSLNCSQSLN